LLNEHLDSWRDGKALPSHLADERRVGTVDWWHEQFYRSEPFKALSSRTQSDYRKALAAIADLPTSLIDAATGDPARTGRLQACSLSQAAVDKIYKRLRRNGAEWHQRPEDVRAGRITWTDYRPADRPTKVLVFHHKTRKRVWKLLEVAAASRRRLYPELKELIAALPRLGVPMVMFQPQRGAKGPDGTRAARLYSESYAQHPVQDLRRAADLPATFTLEACRHGGMTELGDAELTEQEIMTLSTHATPDAARIYVKRSERQELTAALKRRDFVERKRTKQG
jgi:hypothetical protein